MLVSISVPERNAGENAVLVDNTHLSCCIPVSLLLRQGTNYAKHDSDYVPHLALKEVNDSKEDN
jgi:hypothetical protein